MQIVILAGGKATRLYPMTKNIPKSLIMIHGKPFLEYQIELLKKNNIDVALICAGMFSEQIMEHFGDGKNFGISIKYSVEQSDKLLGTAGAIKKAENQLEDVFFVMYGDSYLPIEFNKILDEFKKSGKLGLMSVYKNNNKYDKSNVDIENNMIITYDKSGKNTKLSYIDYGLLVLKKDAIGFVPDNEYVNLDFLINKLIENRQLVACEVEKRFYEVGTFDGIKDFESYIKSKS